jgi:hypothetical protein
MENNLPALHRLVESLEPQLGARWGRHVTGAKLEDYQQTCQSVLKALARGQVDEALYAALRVPPPARGEGGTKVPSKALEPSTKRDEAVAAATARLGAERPDQQASIRLMRESILGKAEPLSSAEAWEFIRKGELLANAIPWERLHSGWDRSLQLADTQIAYRTLSFRDSEGLDHQFSAGADSPLATLWIWSESLLRSYGWPRSQAAWFLLTGEPPTLMPLCVQVESGLTGGLSSLITLTVMAGCSEHLLVAGLRAAKRSLLGRNRGPSATARFAMTEFVDQELAKEGRRPDWRELFRRWNQFAPYEWRFDDRPRRRVTARRWHPRYRSAAFMLDAYRREKNVRREVEEKARSATQSRRRRRG